MWSESNDMFFIGSEDSERQAYLQGKKDYDRGASLDENPYDLAYLRGNWNMGYHAREWENSNL